MPALPSHTLPDIVKVSAPGTPGIRNLFLRLLGGIFLVAFASLHVQLPVLLGSHGLLPACAVAGAAPGPTLFSLACSDRALGAAAVLGELASVCLVAGLLPLWSLALAWGLYLSFVNVGQDFLSFQWDNLLLETGFFSLFVAPRALWLHRAGPPPALGVFGLRWLLVRLNVESGLAKLLFGDPTWRDLTAMVGYYETAPLPTWVGWWAHQLPVWAHRVCGGFTYVVELGLPLAIFGPWWMRVSAFAGLVLFQLGVIATANYGYFNYLSLALALWALATRQRLGMPGGAAAALLAIVTCIPFFPFVPALRPVVVWAAPVRSLFNQLRSVNAYHLFAHMTLVRREPVIEGSLDGVTWLPYEFRYKPGAIDRAPPFVAPHQPRVDFQLWFLLLGRSIPPYVETLFDRLLTEPASVASLFAADPFGGAAPRQVRLAVYRYRFTDRTTRAGTGAWWDRRLEGTTTPVQGRTRSDRPSPTP